MATYLWYNFFTNCFVASWGFIMFKKQKEKLKQQIAFAKIDIKESAKKKIIDAVSPQEPPQRHYDYSGQKEIKFHLERMDKKAIAALSEYNTEYDTVKAGKRKNVPKYKYPRRPVGFSATDDNIRVSLCGKYIGYAPADMVKPITEILDSGKLRYMDAYFFGGQYKLVTETGVFPENVDLGCSIRIKYD